VKLASAETGTLLLARPEIAYAVRLGHVALSCSVFLDWALSRVHYDLRDADQLVTVAAPWRVRPGGALLVQGRL
jgi:hypothetical protein